MSPPSTCSHRTLQVESSSNAKHVGVKSFTLQQLFTAATGSRKRLKAEEHGLYSSHTFPAPLVLPGDELSCDPKYPPQSFKSWLNEGARNVVTENKRTIYVATAPTTALPVKDVTSGWDLPKSQTLKGKRLITRPAFAEILNYLEAFFHGVPVKRLPLDQKFSGWTHHQKQGLGKKKQWEQGTIDLRSSQANIKTQIRVRHVEESEERSPYSVQLNLNDLLDHAMAILPSDAYCLLLLMDYDLYEDEQDDFCCGRAYGGSRIAVVSTAQYQPVLDSWHRLFLREGHFWPGSHCSAFVEGDPGTTNTVNSTRLGKRHRGPAKAKNSAFEKSDLSEENTADSAKDTPDEIDIMAEPMQAAFHCHVTNLSASTFSQHDLESIYLRRVTLIAAHELLHCFGLDHCVYRACAMQGTASILEDSRQPPYLCCVCENKLARAMADGKAPRGSIEKQDSSGSGWWETQEIMEWKKARQEQILKFCERRGTANFVFGPLIAWIQGYLEVHHSTSNQAD